MNVKRAAAEQPRGWRELGYWAKGEGEKGTYKEKKILIVFVCWRSVKVTERRARVASYVDVRVTRDEWDMYGNEGSCDEALTPHTT